MSSESRSRILRDPARLKRIIRIPFRNQDNPYLFLEKEREREKKHEDPASATSDAPEAANFLIARNTFAQREGVVRILWKSGMKRDLKCSNPQPLNAAYIFSFRTYAPGGVRVKFPATRISN